MNLSDFGWDDDFENNFKEFRENKLLPARVIESSRLVYKLISGKGEIAGKLSGKFRYNCHSRGDFPTVGDWIAFKPGQDRGFVSIRGMLQRKSKFSRKVAGKVSDEQVIAANIDTIFIVSGLNQDFNIRRLERYVTLAADSCAEFVFILNKADLCKDVERVATEIKNLFKDTQVYALSALSNRGLGQITGHIKAGKTIVFLGSSGVGKSTIINRLLGEERQKTGHLSEHDGRGRHITTSKNLILLPDGGIVIDTPGLRELQLLCSGEGLKNAFSDIELLAGKCKYKNCTHTNEPGCAVLTAVDEGIIPKKRLDNYHKLKREIEYNLFRNDERFKNKRNKFRKMISKQAKIIKKFKEGPGDYN